jgi:hypothetical protein
MIAAEFIALTYTILGIGSAIVFRKIEWFEMKPTGALGKITQMPLGNLMLAMFLMFGSLSLLVPFDVATDGLFNSLTANQIWFSNSVIGNYINANFIYGGTYLNLPTSAANIPADLIVNSLNSNYIFFSNSIYGNYINANFIYGGTYLNLPATAATCGSVCTANVFVGYNALSYLAINDILANGIDATTFDGNVTGNNGVYTSVSANTFLGNVIANNGIFSNNVTSTTFVGNTVGNTVKLINPNGYNVVIDYATAAATNVIVNVQGQGGNLACTGCGNQKFTATNIFTGMLYANGITTYLDSNEILATTSNVNVNNALIQNVGQIRWNAPGNTQLQYVSKTVYSNTNSSMWIIYTDIVGVGSMTANEDITAAPTNTIFKAASTVGSTEDTFMVPYGFAIQFTYTGTVVFNSLLLK